MNLYKLSIAADIGDDQVTIFQGEVPARYDAYWSKPNHTCNLDLQGTSPRIKNQIKLLFLH